MGQNVRDCVARGYADLERRLELVGLLPGACLRSVLRFKSVRSGMTKRRLNNRTLYQ